MLLFLPSVIIAFRHQGEVHAITLKTHWPHVKTRFEKLEPLEHICICIHSNLIMLSWLHNRRNSFSFSCLCVCVCPSGTFSSLDDASWGNSPPPAPPSKKSEKNFKVNLFLRKAEGNLEALFSPSLPWSLSMMFKSSPWGCSPTATPWLSLLLIRKLSRERPSFESP